MSSERKPSSWPAEVLLPILQALAEGSWLAVVYAALQALGDQPTWLGPFEIGAAALAGLAWGRRTRWRGPVAEALGLPLLAFAAGAVGWALDPEVRTLIFSGQPLQALGLHLAGWIAGIGFWRGELHFLREDDVEIQDRLLRWGLPGLAIPWLVGHLAVTPELESQFTTAALFGTLTFVASGLAAMGLARLEAGRVAGGSDWRTDRSWLVLIGGVALIVVVLAIPAALFLGVPARGLIETMAGPFQTLFILFFLGLALPLLFVGSAVADLVHSIFPDLGAPSGSDVRQFVGGLQNREWDGPALIIFWILMALIASMILLIIGTLIWLRVQERRSRRAEAAAAFEERSFERRTVVTDELRPTWRRRGRAVRGPRDSADDPTRAYLAALEALERDGRWARGPAETPAAHAARVRAAGMPGTAFARLAAAYQLERYAELPLTTAERGRSRDRLRALRRALSLSG